LDVIAAFGWKEPERVSMRDPEMSKQLKGWLRKGHVAIFVSLAVADMNHHTGAINITNLKMCAFLKPKAAGTDRGETDSIAR
jgi:hypothetical protein